MSSPTLGGFSAIDRESLSDRVLTALRPAIITGTIAPDTHLSEVPLSTSLGVSRGTVREALAVLQREGLAEVDHRGRMRVPHLDSTAIRETFQVREALEAMAARLIVEQGKVEESSPALEARIAEMRESRSRSLFDQVNADIAFHRTLVESAGNSALLANWEALAGRVSMAILYAGAERAVENMSPERHVQLLVALQSNSTRVVVFELRTHFCQALECLGVIATAEADAGTHPA